MKEEYLSFLCCPVCNSDLLLESKITHDSNIEEGVLICKNCKINYPIKNFIPRFVNQQGYAESFGSQWNAFAKTQLDDEHTKESTLRFNSEIGWKASELTGKTVIEIGSGAGRFVEVVSSRGAKLAVGIDMTSAVDAAQDNLGNRENVFFIQADAFHLPIKKSYFNFAYSIGVLHHTPDPQLAFESMVDTVEDEGKIGLSLYEISLYSRPNRNSLKVVSMDLLWALNMWRCELFRLFTTRVPHVMMIAYCKTIIPILHHLNKVPVIGLIRYLFPSTCYRNLPVAWSMLDTMDTYSTEIVHQYRAKDIFQWFLKIGLTDMILMNGRAGWVSLIANKGNWTSRKDNALVLEKPASLGNIGD
jgi:uncharacterized protein YbaR (Trm112 family)/ubiquinone/menaquinone biosynthesis C-methylase UbiE